MTDNTIRWLHLTDLHVGAKRQDCLWPRFKGRFLAALDQNLQDFGPCDLVLFTGDLAHKGTREQYKKLDGIFKDIWDVFKKRKCNPKLLAVPGNHDLQRPASDKGTVVALESWSNNPTVQRNFWEKEDGEYRQLVSTALADYQEWWSNTPYRPDGIRQGVLPGDFHYTFEKGDLRLGIVGLNSTFLQLTDKKDYKGRLAVDLQQFFAMFPEDENGIEWADSHNACILMTHHPPDWLSATSGEQLKEEILESFCLHLCGHNHVTEVWPPRQKGSLPFRWVGRSLFGVKFFEAESAPSQRSHGYALGELRRDDQGQGKLRFTPLLLKKSGETKSIEPDNEEVQLPNKQQTDDFPVQLRHLTPSTDPSRETVVPADAEGLLKNVLDIIEDVLNSTPGLRARLQYALDSHDPKLQNAARDVVDLIFASGLRTALKRFADFVQEPEARVFQDQLLRLVEAFSALGVSPERLKELRKILEHDFVNIPDGSTPSMAALLAGALLDAPVEWVKGPKLDPVPKHYIAISEVPFGGNETVSVIAELGKRVENARDVIDNQEIMLKIRARMLDSPELGIPITAETRADNPESIRLIEERLGGLRDLEKPLFTILREDEAAMRVIEQDPENRLWQDILVFRSTVSEKKNVVPEALRISTILNGILERLESKPGPSTTRR